MAEEVQGSTSTTETGEALITQPPKDTPPTDGGTPPAGDPTPPKEGEPTPAPTPPATPPAPAKDTPPPKPVEGKDLKLSDGSLLDPSRVEKIAAEARERGLSTEQAQEIVATEEKAVAAYVEQSQAQTKQWIEDAKKDPEIGANGDEKVFEQNIELAKRGVDVPGSCSPELKKMLNETGAGNHPEMIRHFMWIGKQVAEDKLVAGRPASGESKSLAEKLYGKTSK